MSTSWCTLLWYTIIWRTAAVQLFIYLVLRSICFWSTRVYLSIVISLYLVGITYIISNLKQYSRPHSASTRSCTAEQQACDPKVAFLTHTNYTIISTVVVHVLVLFIQKSHVSWFLLSCCLNLIFCRYLDMMLVLIWSSLWWRNAKSSNYLANTYSSRRSLLLLLHRTNTIIIERQ